MIRRSQALALFALLCPRPASAGYQFIPAQPDPLDVQADKLDTYVQNQLRRELGRAQKGHNPIYNSILELPREKQSALLPAALKLIEDRARFRDAATAALNSGDFKGAEQALAKMRQHMETVGKNAPEALERELRKFLFPESVYPAPCQRLDLGPVGSGRAAFYEALVGNFPDDASLRLGLSQALLCAKRYEEALGEAVQAAGIEPSLPDAYYATAFAADKLGDHEYATCYKLKALEMRSGGSRTACTRRAPRGPASAMNFIKFEPDPEPPPRSPAPGAYDSYPRPAPFNPLVGRPRRQPSIPAAGGGTDAEGPDGQPYHEPKVSITSNGRTRNLSEEVEIRVIDEPEKPSPKAPAGALLASAGPAATLGQAAADRLARAHPSPYPTSGMPPTSPDELPKLLQALRVGDRNDRTHAVQSLGIMGAAGLEGLSYAMDDGDWVVRLTAAHWLGRLGPVAAPSLAEAMRTDPCRIVRLTALHWVGSLGPDALDALEGTEGDESKVVQGYSRYWRWKLKHPDATAPAEDPESVNPADYGEDLNVCTNMDQPGRLKKSVLLAQARAGPPIKGKDEPTPQLGPPGPPLPAPTRDNPVPQDLPPAPPAPTASPATHLTPAPPPLPRDIDQLLELDFQKAEELAHPREIPLSKHPKASAPATAELPQRPDEELSLAPRLGEPESLPLQGGSGRPDAREDSGAPGEKPPREGAQGELSGRLTGEKEKLPAPKAPVHWDKKVQATAELLESQKGPIGYDAIPALIEILKRGNPRLRSRAADELGKMGRAADKAVLALVAALSDPSDRVRSCAALALGNIGPAADSAVPLLRRAIRDKNPDVSYSAVLALARMKTPAATKAYKSYLRDEVRQSNAR